MRSVVSRFNNRWDFDENGCAVWNKISRKDGYGEFWMDGRSYLAHRAAYLLTFGSIPEGYEIDHLCRNRSCVNPSHLEAVTKSENLKRQGQAVQACPQGHKYTEENTYLDQNGRGLSRKCITCKRAMHRRLYQERKLNGTHN